MCWAGGRLAVRVLLLCRGAAVLNGQLLHTGVNHQVRDPLLSLFKPSMPPPAGLTTHEHAVPQRLDKRCGTLGGGEMMEPESYLCKGWLANLLCIGVKVK